MKGGERERESGGETEKKNTPKGGSKRIPFNETASGGDHHGAMTESRCWLHSRTDFLFKILLLAVYGCGTMF